MMSFLIDRGLYKLSYVVDLKIETIWKHEWRFIRWVHFRGEDVELRESFTMIIRLTDVRFKLGEENVIWDKNPIRKYIPTMIYKVTCLRKNTWMLL